MMIRSLGTIREAWEQLAQKPELDWWMEGNGPSTLSEAVEISCWIMKRFGFAKNLLTRQTVLDVGPGPTGRLAWLDGQAIAIEPLAKAYRAVPNARMEKYHTIYPVPVEQHVPELERACDGVLSLNALDHGYDFRQALRHIHGYAKPGGWFFLSVDVDKIDLEDPQHPIRLTHESCAEELQRAGFVITRTDKGHCYPEADYIRDNWGGGVAYHWWCERRREA